MAYHLHFCSYFNDAPVYTCQVTRLAYVHARGKQECDCYVQSSQTFGKRRFLIVINKILPPGYMQTEEMFNL